MKTIALKNMSDEAIRYGHRAYKRMIEQGAARKLSNDEFMFFSWMCRHAAVQEAIAFDCDPHFRPLQMPPPQQRRFSWTARGVPWLRYMFPSSSRP